MKSKRPQITAQQSLKGIISMSMALSQTKISACSAGAPLKLDLYGAPVAAPNRPSSKEVTKTQEGILNLIFGTKDIPPKRGSQRWASYNEDLTVRSIAVCAMNALSKVVLPVLTKFQENEMLHIQATEAMRKKEKGVVLPPQYDPRPDLEKRCNEIFLPEFVREVGVLTTRKVFQSVVKRFCSDKLADKFCREFYPKLRRTMKRYGNGFMTYSKIYSAASFIALTDHVPFLLYDVLIEMGSLYYRYSFGEVDSDRQEDLIEEFSKKTQLMAYNVVRDASIRTLLVAVNAVFGSSFVLNFGMPLELGNELLFIALQLASPMVLNFIVEKIQNRAI